MITLVKKDRSRLTAAALGRIPCDLAIENARLVNVFTGEIYSASVDVLDGVVVRIRDGCTPAQLKAQKTVDAEGRYLVPGFVDAHLHVESSLMVPENFGKAEAVWGTTTVIADPHEIANVMGAEGVKYMLENGKKSPIRLFQLAPSCIPSLPGLETAGAEFGAEDIAGLLEEEGILGIGEMMDYYGVANDEKRMHDIAAEGDKRGCFIQGHAPTFKGDNLCAYLCGGPVSDHECVGVEEMIAKRRMGLHVDVRVHNKDQAQRIIGALTPGEFKDTIALCTDDVNAFRLKSTGALNRTVSDLISVGLDPVYAIRFGTYNAAKEYDFADVGAVAPGYSADIQLVDDLEFKNHPHMVFMQGKLIARDGEFLGEPARKSSCGLANSVNYVGISGGDDFRIPAEGKNSRRVMITNRGYETKTPVYETLGCRNGFAELAKEKLGEVNYICVLNRYKKMNKTLALYAGFGLKKGAIASSIGHDCHNIFIVYADADDAFTAVSALKECGGGICFAQDGEVKALLRLPVAGLMSELPLDEVAAECEEFENKTREITGISTFAVSNVMFNTLPVFERFTPTDLGVVDGPGKKFVEHIM